MYIKPYCVGTKFCFQFHQHNHGLTPASCITQNRDCSSVFTARAITRRHLLVVFKGTSIFLLNCIYDCEAITISLLKYCQT